jgi:aspartokinase
MARIVMKFGGTSVGDLDRIRNVANRVKREVEAGHEVAVVVSAMAGTTNQLVKWCQELSPLHDAREYDVVVATGEQVTIGLLAIALQAVGVDARSWQGWQIPVVTDAAHGKARIAATSTPMSMASTPPTRASCPAPASWTAFPMRRCWNLPRSGPRCCRPALSNSP